MKLSEIATYEPEARRLGVSKVARSSSGFLSAYKRAGSASKLSKYWLNRRNNFIKRHLAQVKKNNEKLYNPKTGKYSRRFYVLVMWGFMPI